MELDPKHYLKYSKIQMGDAAEVIEQIGLKGGERLLDIGCGDGKITALLNEMAGEAVGIDLSENMVSFAQELFPHIRFEKQNAEEMTFEAPFDVITCLSALHWMRRPLQALEKMHAALKPGGRAYILTYPKESIYWRATQKAAHDPLFRPYYSSIALVYSAQRYCEMAVQAGFEVISSQLEDHFATHDTLEDAKAYIQGWLPSYINIPPKLRGYFIDLAVQYHAAQSVDRGDGKFHFPYTKLVMVLATRSK